MVTPIASAQLFNFTDAKPIIGQKPIIEQLFQLAMECGKMEQQIETLPALNTTGKKDLAQRCVLLHNVSGAYRALLTKKEEFMKAVAIPRRFVPYLVFKEEIDRSIDKSATALSECFVNIFTRELEKVTNRNNRFFQAIIDFKKDPTTDALSQIQVAYEKAKKRIEILSQLDTKCGFQDESTSSLFSNEMTKKYQTEIHAFQVAKTLTDSSPWSDLMNRLIISLKHCAQNQKEMNTDTRTKFIAEFETLIKNELSEEEQDRILDYQVWKLFPSNPDGSKSGGDKWGRYNRYTNFHVFKQALNIAMFEIYERKLQEGTVEGVNGKLTQQEVTKLYESINSLTTSASELTWIKEEFVSLIPSIKFLAQLAIDSRDTSIS